MQRDILAVVIELLVALTRRTIVQFFPDGDLPVPDALALLHAVETLALRQMQGHQTTLTMLSRRTQIHRQTLHRYLERMRQAGLIYSEGRNYYVDLNRFNSSENAAHLAAKVDDIIRAANQLTQIQNGNANWSVAL
jgi:DNA-binding IclR family transcriptional regulator